MLPRSVFSRALEDASEECLKKRLGAWALRRTRQGGEQAMGRPGDWDVLSLHGLRENGLFSRTEVAAGGPTCGAGRCRVVASPTTTAIAVGAAAAVAAEANTHRWRSNIHRRTISYHRRGRRVNDRRRRSINNAGGHWVNDRWLSWSSVRAGIAVARCGVIHRSRGGIVRGARGQSQPMTSPAVTPARTCPAVDHPQPPPQPHPHPPAEAVSTLAPAIAES